MQQQQTRMQPEQGTTDIHQGKYGIVVCTTTTTLKKSTRLLLAGFKYYEDAFELYITMDHPLKVIIFHHSSWWYHHDPKLNNNMCDHQESGNLRWWFVASMHKTASPQLSNLSWSLLRHIIMKTSGRNPSCTIGIMHLLITLFFLLSPR